MFSESQTLLSYIEKNLKESFHLLQLLLLHQSKLVQNLMFLIFHFLSLYIHMYKYIDIVFKNFSLRYILFYCISCCNSSRSSISISMLTFLYLVIVWYSIIWIYATLPNYYFIGGYQITYIYIYFAVMNDCGKTLYTIFIFMYMCK